MFRCVVFGEVISPIVFTTDPTDVSFVLLYLITDPVVVHVNCAGSLLFNSVVSNSIGSGVVSVDCGCFLWISHFRESCAQDGGFFAVNKEGSQFSFGS